MSQASEVENQLRKMILNMDLGPGERLTERWAEAVLTRHERLFVPHYKSWSQKGLSAVMDYAG
jgi:hypothetical protein